ncbi:metal-dependent hydrolase [Polaribacter phage Freya_1]|uniref:Beta-lactamase superfamily domain protein n=1 Tax=Polaribacter phage Freya_1 TaxID=2745662 RepID=A0A8E4ZMB2_9CAUD|nr:metal-dependent hydrolase [Polaribacter phage Freya_1]QQV90983.1 beta-lactamase superfamily domain protein [Polaribacter phage Freya_2]QQV91051.1 beta-lactamase superfamily domain protein [Polaribacter phage Freya_3]QQV91119.1 beta-lactamase superfamily domain protein [Polaribacter phage Freya_4]QQV91194.1 beta-lactamase superfamily domain protein [Polaribacter phage Freya_8]QQV91271.1 beta-lactamase superfamily domain protein [Polaribacter phage Freya_9]QQV91349.1 beta-lactamase superfami
MESNKPSLDICNILSSGSKGNCIIYHNSIAVDMGVPFSMIKECQNSLQIVLLTHIHGDHFNVSTIKKLALERPTLRFACGDFLADKLEGIKNVDILEAGKIYDYGAFKVSPIVLYHDVPNFGYRIFKGDHKTIHATDTCHLNGITAKNYSLYCVESNYNEDTIFESIKIKQSKGEFAYQTGAINSHLSEQQARDFIFKNKGEHSEVIRLHESTTV